MCIIRFFTSEAFSAHKTRELLQKLQSVDSDIVSLSTELCYHVELVNGCDYLNINQMKILQWLLSTPLQPHALRNETSYRGIQDNQVVIEIGPRFNFSTADSSNSVQICESVGLRDVTRLEVSTRYLITFGASKGCDAAALAALAAPLHDRMTQCVYTRENLPRDSFNEGLPKNLEPWFVVPLLEEGRSAMEKVNQKLGLAFDDWDMDFYMDLFVNKLKRDPTSVELFDLAQSNSEHSRHWFFKGKIILDGKEMEGSLIDMVASTQKYSNQNNVIKFGDNSSAIRGFKHVALRPGSVVGPARVAAAEEDSDIIFTAETHNMPTAVAPFSGAATGAGGRIRDVQAVGRGGHTRAASAGYSVGNLRLPGYEQPWEDLSWRYPDNFASPLQILIEASNGASDYGNKFGEPLITGFVQSFGLKDGDLVRQEFVKPIMFSGGLGAMPHAAARKNPPQPGMLVVKLGGPVYRIGVGGGAASSVPVQGAGDRDAALDFGAVQRGDAEMGNRLNRVVRACLEADVNPIEAIHDQGAGGNGNVLKELVEPAGGVVFTRAFRLGDPTVSTLELWGAEYQENDALLCLPQHRALLEEICARERCPVSFVGAVTGDGYMSLVEDAFDERYLSRAARARPPRPLPYDLQLHAVLGNMPRKTFDLKQKEVSKVPLKLPAGVTVRAALERVLRLVSVGSKRYLTNKVDRCVSGLVAQQQCVGPLHSPLADCGVVALSHHELVGAATSIGTQSSKGLLAPGAGARMALGEALTNLVFVRISALEDVKCSGNWMWAGKTGADGAALAVACAALCGAMRELGVAIDGGKDSLSMCAQLPGETVKSPGTLVVSTYAPVPDVTARVEPALLRRGAALLHVAAAPPAAPAQHRLGGTALAQAYGQLGDTPPDLDSPAALRALFHTTQRLIQEKKLVSGHDISEGGLITTALEMGFGGVRGLALDVAAPPGVPPLAALFHEELGIVVEVDAGDVSYVLQQYHNSGVHAQKIGVVGEFGMQAEVTVRVNGRVELQAALIDVWRLWEETSYRLERLQANADCADQEWRGLAQRRGAPYRVTYDARAPVPRAPRSVRVAVLREEGTNGDREMIAALMMANFEVFDVTMSDLHAGRASLHAFQGLVFPGGFSYADTLGSAKGWAAGILFSAGLWAQFARFKARDDTFSLGVCNGCQLMALLGWVDPCPAPAPAPAPSAGSQIFLDHNLSERFECRWSAVVVRGGTGEGGDGGDPWLRGMDGCVLGVWSAHAQGRFAFRDAAVRQAVTSGHQAALQFVDDAGAPTEVYPMNPNGSPAGLAGVRSPDGRHLAVMPHPERCVLSWQCPAPPPAPPAPPAPTAAPSGHPHASPWLRMFQNAYEWAARQ